VKSVKILYKEVKSIRIDFTQLKQIPPIYIILLLTWGLTIKLKIGSIWFIGSSIFILLANLGQRQKGELSAYSVFNKEFQSLLGTITAEQFEKEIRHENANQRYENNNINNIVGDQVLNDGDEAYPRNLEESKERKVSRKKGKKSRRNYEERLKKKAIEISNETFNDYYSDEDFYFDD
jgi:hypothetical protein